VGKSCTAAGERPGEFGYSASVTDAQSYPPIADYALIGDCHSAALVSRNGSIEWCCLPRFDSGSAFGRLLDAEHGGHCVVNPVGDGDWQYERRYLEDTLVLETTVHGPGGEAKLLDCFTLQGSPLETKRRQILRVVEGVRGSVEFAVRVAPRYDYGQVRPWIRRHGEHLHSAIGGNDAVLIWCEQELREDPQHELAGGFSVGPGDRVRLTLTYCPPEQVDAGPPPEPDAQGLDELLEGTVAWWRGWSEPLALGGRDEAAARHSGIVLKALTYAPTGGVVAAPTTSLPEAIGGSRNWDYRYAWVRDSSFSSRAFAELGALEEADAFRAFIMRSAAGHAGDLQVVYGVGGERRLRRWATTLPSRSNSTPTASWSTSPGAGTAAAIRRATTSGASWSR
jgi:GH15 family glucan-1,4-alpha-glucosidase